MKNNKSNDQARKNLSEYILLLINTLKSNRGILHTPTPIFSEEIRERGYRPKRSPKKNDQVVNKINQSKKNILSGICLLLSFYFIDRAYINENLVLTDLGFYLGIVTILLILLFPIIILFGSGNNYYDFIKKCLHLTQVYFIFELLFIGVSWTSILIISFFSITSFLLYRK